MRSLIVNLLSVLFLLIGTNSQPQEEGGGADQGQSGGEQQQDVIYDPFVVWIVAKSNEATAYGGGSFITMNHVLTQANIILGFLDWTMGHHTTDLINTPGIPVQLAIRHPFFDPEKLINDIGILFTPVLHNSMIVSLPMPFANVPQFTMQGTVYGYGAVAVKPVLMWPPSYQIFQQRMLDDVTCKELLGMETEFVTDLQFCALDDNNVETNKCLFDFANSFVVNEEEGGVPVITGIASFVTNNCDSQFPAVYTRVSPYVEWIAEIVNATESFKMNQ